MSEQVPTDTVTDFSAEYPGDSTQPSDEILRALNSLSPTKIEPSQAQLERPPPTEYEALTTQLKEKPLNPEAWRRLVDLAEQSGDLSKIRETYDALLKQYPNTSSAQIAYLNHFVNDPERYGEAEELFRRWLRSSPSVDLWKFYLTYVRRLDAKTNNRDVICKSYDFALNHVGQDKDSGEIWNDYVQYLRTGETSSTWEEQQKMDALRKVYHKAVQIPLDNVERLWQELETFETNLNRITAKKFMADLSPAHMQARATLRQLTTHLQGLHPPNSFGNRIDLFLPSVPIFDTADRSLVGRWKSYLKWEESNPLELEEKDKATLISRIQGVYRKAVIRLRYFSEIWYMAFTWTYSVGKHDEALSILKSGLEANPFSFLLNTAYAEILETRKEYAEVHTVYDTYLQRLRVELEALEQHTDSTQNGTTNGSLSQAHPMVGIEPASNNSSFNTQVSEDKPPQVSELVERRKEYGVVYIMYMRFGRRAEGVKSSRAIFARARKDRWVNWEVYEAAALMEYHCSGDKDIPSRIFEKGLETFEDELDYVLRYLGFLISINDTTNARALFERVISKFSPDRARPLWERWSRYEYQYGDLEAVQKLERRIADVYPNDPPIKRFAQRHTYLSIDAIASRDLGFTLARKANAQTNGSVAGEPSSERRSAPLGRSETQQSLSSIGATPGGVTHKRASSPDYTLGARKRDESRERGLPGRGGSDYGVGHKRMRPMSPPGRVGERDRERDRDRDRWDGGAGRRRHSPPPSNWDRDRDRPVPARGGDRDEEKGIQRGSGVVVTIPPVLSWFLGQLPQPATFDGPVFRTDDLMNLFRNAVIPSTTAPAPSVSRSKSPPARAGGRPPPDYSPYQGPGGGRGRRY